MEDSIEKLKELSLLKVIFSAVSHVLNLLLLFTYCCKIVESDFKQPLITESLKFFNSLPLINPMLESIPPLRKRNLEDSHTLLLE